MATKAKTKHFWIGATLGIFGLAAGIYVLANVGATFYRINHNQSLTEYAADAIQYLIINTSGESDYFIPNNNLTEWLSFKNAADTYLTDIDVTAMPIRRIISTASSYNANMESVDLVETWYETANDYCQNDSATDNSSRWAALLWGYNGNRYLPQPVIANGVSYINRYGNPLFTAIGNNIVSETLANAVGVGVLGAWTG